MKFAPFPLITSPGFSVFKQKFKNIYKTKNIERKVHNMHVNFHSFVVLSAKNETLLRVRSRKLKYIA